MMFQEMRRKDREISNDQIEQILLEADYGVLSTIGENGYPYGVAVNYIYYKGRIFIHCAAKGHKLNNIKHNNKVSFLIVTDVDVKPEQVSTNYKSVVAFGSAEEIQGDLKDEALKQFIYKYCGDFIDGGLEYVEKAKGEARVFAINIDHMTGKSRNL
ncbi:pyridoxamine 5'-phosphate oxidase family protein [Bacillota bacterium]